MGAAETEICPGCTIAKDWGAMCPEGWAASGHTGCRPPAGYAGPCAFATLGFLDSMEKWSFEIDCDVCWPCLMHRPADSDRSSNEGDHLAGGAVVNVIHTEGN